MAKIHTLEIKNYRGIKCFKHVFNTSNFICLIGRGDSGKTTLLNAIAAVLSPNWNYTFYDTDFFEGDINTPIEIIASLKDLPTELLTENKYGLYKRILGKNNEIIDNIDNNSEESVDILTIKLEVKKDLEPKWYVINNRINQKEIEISANDRTKLNAFMVSDYLDRHFTLSKGSPLYSLLKNSDFEEEIGDKITDSNINIKKLVNENNFFDFLEIYIERIKKTAQKIGLSADELTAMIDFKENLVKEGNIALYNKLIPYRLSGKGTRRLLSIAIQLELINEGGIVLIDEIEQGLEPDRVKFLVKKLNELNKNGQIFITTHSSNVIEELNAENIYLMRRDSKNLINFDNDFQACLRSNPSSFFGKKIIVCEGKTEIGICRALNKFREKKNNLNFETIGIGLADGRGANLYLYSKKFKEAGFDVCVLCDSDVEDKTQKDELISSGILIVDYDKGNSIEDQVFNDLPWKKINDLIEKIKRAREDDSSDLSEQIKNDISNLIKNDTPENRKKLAKIAKDGKWFKRIDFGEILGQIWFDSLPELNNTTLKTQYEKLNEWIDK